MPDNIIYYKETDSTNTRLRLLVNEGHIKCGLVCIADSQTGGKGRNGRFFFSPGKTGIYLSVFLCPKVTGANIATISAIASVCVINAIKEITGIDTGIKWINDIYLRNKKVGGILCEILSEPFGGVKGVIVGVGLNCTSPAGGFPDDLKDIVGSLNIELEKKDKLTNQIIKNLREIQNGGIEWLSAYKEASVVLGKDIVVIPGLGQPYKACATDIDDTGALLVVDENGQTQRLFSGEISIRF